MKMNKTLITVLTLVVALAAIPAFAQKGQGLGVGAALGGQSRVNVGGGAATNAGVQAGGTNAGVNTNAGVQAKTDVDAKGGGKAHVDDASHGVAGANIVTRIDGNPELASRVQAMLPSGETISQAAAGFKNEGQFIAALHVSQNLGIPFDQLKAKMTGSDAMSLGAAIHALKPAVSEKDSKEEAKKAENEAKSTMAAKASASNTTNSSTKASSTSSNTSSTAKTTTSSQTDKR